MNTEDKVQVIELYNKSLSQYGDTAEAVQSRLVSQRYRFKVLTEIACLEDEKILDYGCGKGDLYPYLVEMGFRGCYTGFDVNPELIGLAKRKFPGTKFEVKDIEEDEVREKFSYVLISGIFNNRISDNWSFMKNVLTKCFECTTKGLAFNALSTYVNFRDPPLFYASPEETFRFCVSELSRYVTLRHDNLPFNYTVYVYRKRDWAT